MKLRRWLGMIHGVVLLITLVVSAPQYASAAQSDVVLTDWQAMWIKQGQSEGIIPNLDGTWLDVGVDNPLTELPPWNEGNVDQGHASLYEWLDAARITY